MCLSRAPIDGSGPVETLADDLAFAEKLIVDENFIYVIEGRRRQPDANDADEGADRTSRSATPD